MHPTLSVVPGVQHRRRMAANGDLTLSYHEIRQIAADDIAIVEVVAANCTEFENYGWR